MALAIGLLGTLWQHETSCYPSMMFSCWMGTNLVALVWLSMRFKSPTASHLRSGLVHSSATTRRGARLALGYVGCRGHMPQPIAMVQCCGTGEEERQDAMLLCRFLQAQCAYQEGFLSAATDTGSITVVLLQCDLSPFTLNPFYFNLKFGTTH